MACEEDIFRVVLFGHRIFYGLKELDEFLFPLLCNLIQTKAFVEIYIGRNGDFDLDAATVVKRVQKAMGKENNEFICVLPYPVRFIEDYEKYYDRVLIPESIGRTHPKSAITKRNRWMVEQADLFVCYVESEEGGAYAAMKYAERLHKKIINLAKKKNALQED